MCRIKLLFGDCFFCFLSSFSEIILTVRTLSERIVKPRRRHCRRNSLCDPKLSSTHLAINLIISFNFTYHFPLSHVVRLDLPRPLLINAAYAKDEKEIATLERDEDRAAELVKVEMVSVRARAVQENWLLR